jgi:hypothetical protein
MVYGEARRRWFLSFGQSTTTLSLLVNADLGGNDIIGF